MFLSLKNMKNMKNTLVLTTLLSLAPITFAHEPKEIVAIFHDALSKGDTAKVMNILAPNVIIYESGYVEHSRAEYAAHHLPEDIKFAQRSSLKVLNLAEKRTGDFSLVMEETETTAQQNNKQVKYFGTGSLLLEKINDEWLITHIHWSSRKK
jgi:ketosteroid isomerase-like protein